MSQLIEQIFSRIDFLKTKYSYTDEQIAKGIGLSQSGYSRIRNRSRTMKVEFVESVARFFEIPLAYLFLNEGELGVVYLREILKNYISDKGKTVDQVATEIGLNVLRLIEILNGSTINSDERRLINQFFEQVSEHLKRWDELLALMLLEMGVDESKITLIIDYMNVKGFSKGFS